MTRPYKRFPINALPLVRGFTSPHSALSCKHVQGTDRQTPQQPFHQTCRLTPNRSHSRPCDQPNSPRASHQAGKEAIVSAFCSCCVSPPNQLNTQKCHATPPSSAQCPYVGPPACSNGRIYFSIPRPRQMMHHTTIDHPKAPWKLAPSLPLKTKCLSLATVHANRVIVSIRGCGVSARSVGFFELKVVQVILEEGQDPNGQPLTVL